VQTTERIETVPVEATIPFLQWIPVVAGAFVAAAVLVILMAVRSAIGFSIVSSSPTWRDASPALTVASGLYLLLTALVSFGFGGYVIGRLRERWTTSGHSDVVEFPGWRAWPAGLGYCSPDHRPCCSRLGRGPRVEGSTTGNFS
jgi:hypothetical protein